MSLKVCDEQSVLELTKKIAKKAFSNGNRYLCLRDKLGSIFSNSDFLDLYHKVGQPALAAWRLALVTVLQFGESLPDS